MNRYNLGENLLYCAVKSNNIRKVRTILNRRMACNENDRYEKIPLCLAVKKGNLEMVSLLLKYCANVNITSAKGNTALDIAVINMSLPIATCLLDYGAWVSCERTALYTALKNESCDEMVKLLINRGADINVQNHGDETILYEFVKKGNIDAVERVLNNEPDVNNKSNKRALLAAIDFEHVNSSNIVDKLLNHGFTVTYADANCSDLTFAAIENLAATTGKVSIVKLFFEFNDVIVEFDDYESILQMAVGNGYVDVVKLILEYEDNLDRLHLRVNSFLHIALKYENADVLQLILDYIHDINENEMHGNTVLRRAIEEKMEDNVKYLLQYENNIDSQDALGNSLLFTAVQSGNLNIVNSILRYLPKVDNESNNKSFSFAIRNLCDDIVVALRNYGFNISYEDTINRKFLHDSVKNGHGKIIETILSARSVTPVKRIHSTVLPTSENIKYISNLLKVAVEGGRKEIVEILLFYGADSAINAVDCYGSTALACAVSQYVDYSRPFSKEDKDFRAIVKILISKGADTNIAFNNGTSPIHIACCGGDDTNMVQILLDGGVNIHVKNARGETPLHLAAWRGNEKIAESLLIQGASANCKDIDKGTPLQCATIASNTDIVKLLLKFGANVNSKNSDAQAALHYVKSAKYELLKYLLDSGADVNCIDVEWHTAYFYIYYWKKYDGDNADDSSSDEEFFSDLESSNDILKGAYLTQHILKLKCANLYLCPQNLELIHKCPPHESRKFMQNCANEIVNLKNESFVGSTVTLYKILRGDLNQLSMYAKNDDLIENFKNSADIYKEQFPLYFHMIRNNLRRGLMKNQPWKSFVESFNSLLGFAVPYTCAIRVFQYLNETDLYSFTQLMGNPIYAALNYCE